LLYKDENKDDASAAVAAFVFNESSCLNKFNEMIQLIDSALGIRLEAPFVETEPAKIDKLAGEH
jgi:hypothetical protein